MKYKMKVVKNDTETYTDDLYFNDMIPSILNNVGQPKFITPLTSYVCGGAMAFNEVIEKNLDNIDLYSNTKIGSSTYSNDKFTFTGMDGHIGSICLTYATTINNWDKTGYDYDNTLPNSVFNDVYHVDTKNRLVYAVDGIDYGRNDVKVLKSAVKENQIQYNGYLYKEITSTNYKDLVEKEIMTTLPSSLIHNGYYYSFSYSDPENPLNRAFSFFDQDYGNYNGLSITQDKENIYFTEFYRYYIVDFYDNSSKGTTAYGGGTSYTFTKDYTTDIKTIMNIVKMNKTTGTYSSKQLTDLNDNKTITIKAGNYKSMNEFKCGGSGVNRDYRIAASDGTKLYFVGQEYDTAENAVKKIYTMDIESLDSVVYMQDYDASILHTINRKNAVYQSSFVSFENERFGIGNYKGINNITGIFKGGFSAISNFDIDVVSSDVLTITFEVEE